MNTRRPRVLSSLLTTTLLAGLGACTMDEELALELDADDELRSASAAYHIELDDVLFAAGNSYIELDGGSLEESTPTSWHLRLSAADISVRDCIRANDKVWLRDDPIGTNAQHYTTTPKTWSFALGFSETWQIVDAEIADPGGCLAPGDSFKLRSNYAPNPYLSSGRITLGAGDGHAIYDDGSVLEYNDVSLLRDGQYFHTEAAVWATHATMAWSLRTVEPTVAGCIEADAAVYVGFDGTPNIFKQKPYYSPWGMSAASNSAAWDIIPVDIASPDNCLGPGDRFKLRSHANNSLFHGGEVITYEASDSHNTKFMPEVLDLDGVPAVGGELIIDHNWIDVEFPHSFADPVVIVGPATDRGPDPTAVRLRNVTSQGFEIRLQEWNYLDGTHGLEAVDYLVIESGHHVTNNGVVIQAGRFVAHGRLHKLTHTNFSQIFATAPKIFTTVQSYFGLDTVTSQVTKITNGGFSTVMVEQESNTDGHLDEWVGYLALSGTPASSSFQTHHTATTDVNHVMDGGQIGSQLYYLQLQEEKSADSETAHPYEEVDLFRIVLQDATKLTFAQVVSYAGADPFSIRCAAWAGC